MGLGYLTVLRLHHQASASMEDTGFSELSGGCRHSGVKAMPSRFYRDQLYPGLVKKVIKSACCIASASHTSQYMRRQFGTRLFQQLRPHFLADRTLKACYHVRVRMRP